MRVDEGMGEVDMVRARVVGGLRVVMVLEMVRVAVRCLKLDLAGRDSACSIGLEGV